MIRLLFTLILTMSPTASLFAFETSREAVIKEGYLPLPFSEILVHQEIVWFRLMDNSYIAILETPISDLSNVLHYDTEFNLLAFGKGQITGNAFHVYLFPNQSGSSGFLVIESFRKEGDQLFILTGGNTSSLIRLVHH